MERSCSAARAASHGRRWLGGALRALGHGLIVVAHRPRQLGPSRRHEGRDDRCPGARGRGRPGSGRGAGSAGLVPTARAGRREVPRSRRWRGLDRWSRGVQRGCAPDRSRMRRCDGLPPRADGDRRPTRPPAPRRWFQPDPLRDPASGVGRIALVVQGLRQQRGEEQLVRALDSASLFDGRIAAVEDAEALEGAPAVGAAEIELRRIALAAPQGRRQLGQEDSEDPA